MRNVKPLWSRLGTLAGVSLGGLDMWLYELFGWSPFGTMRHGKPDHATLKPLAEVEPIVYPKPDGVLTFDRLSSVFLSNTNHEEDQPSHLVLAGPVDPDPRATCRASASRPASTARPASTRSSTATPSGGPTRSFVINAQNCVHCKTCDIKDPAQNINWVTPEGGGGPNYVGM